MEHAQLAEPELSFSSWCSSSASASSSEATQGPSEEVEEASASSSSEQTGKIAIRCQPIVLLHKQHHKHRKRPEPPLVRSLF